MKNVIINNRTSLRLNSKNSTNFIVEVGKSRFEKVTNNEGEVSFKVIDIEDPTNPRRNYAIMSESKFITAIMNRVYYQQQEKGVKNPIKVVEMVEKPEVSAVKELKTEQKPKTPKKVTKKSPKKSAKKVEVTS